MTVTHTRFIQPLDVLFLRGNRLFGDAGSYGESQLPPWPSVAAGALRSLVYAQTSQVLTAPQDFCLTAFHLARKAADDVEPLYALPADLSVSGSKDQLQVQRLQPTALASGIVSSAPLPQVPVLAQGERSKAQTGCWLSRAGWQGYLAGHTPAADHLVHSSQLWQLQHRVGVGLEPGKRSAADGKLFSMQAIVFNQNVGFVTASIGNTALPQSGTLRLGGDGRGAALSTANANWPTADHAAICSAGRARIVLTTPGLFPEGWRLPGMAADGRLQLPGLQARVVAAAVPRAEVVSGWDMAQHQPKDAQRVAPTGSVYWLQDLQADPVALDKLAMHGLWLQNSDDEDQSRDTARRVEGFNRFAFAAY